jgi:predicted GTPase
MLGQIRGKFTTLPIPGESVTLNHSELLSQAKEEQQQLKEKLMEMFKEVEYKELVKYDAESSEATEKIFKASPLPIFVG